LRFRFASGIPRVTHELLFCFVRSLSLDLRGSLASNLISRALLLGSGFSLAPRGLRTRPDALLALRQPLDRRPQALNGETIYRSLPHLGGVLKPISERVVFELTHLQVVVCLGSRPVAQTSEAVPVGMASANVR